MIQPKDRLLFLLELLNHETDEEHPITVAEIIDRLNAVGFTATRKTVAKDIDTLLAHGVDVVCNKSRQNKYFIGNRAFELPELTLLVDAVQAAKFISVKQSRRLIEKLSALTSVHQAAKLNRQLYVEKQVKSVNEKVFYTVDLLQTAIQTKRQVTFQYFEYTAAKKKVLKHGGQIYAFSPYSLLWNNDSYYALGFSKSHGRLDNIHTCGMCDCSVLPYLREHHKVSIQIQTLRAEQRQGKVKPYLHRGVYKGSID
ncbi:MAG: WYL domain-containing protein [Clostridiales bacterium]|nr:WYL domain-containing protein [Clostridiales bacterium]